MSRILDSMHLFCCLQYIFLAVMLNSFHIQFKCILHLYNNSTQIVSPIGMLNSNPIVLHYSMVYHRYRPPFAQMFHFVNSEHVIYEWMNIVCVCVWYMYNLYIHIECHELTPVFTSCHHRGVYLYGWDWKYPTFHLNGIPKLYTIVMWNSNVALQFYIMDVSATHFSNSLMYAVQKYWMVYSEFIENCQWIALVR